MVRTDEPASLNTVTRQNEMENLSEFCASRSRYREETIPVSDHVALRVITFTPSVEHRNPPLVFVAGWISRIRSWQEVLLELTKDFTVYYTETREKRSSRIKEPVEYSVQAIGKDVAKLVSHLNLKPKKYILMGSSLGATAILDGCRFLQKNPLCLVLISPNAVFRVPRIGYAVVRIFPPRLYAFIKPVVKAYLKTCRLDVRSDPAQYEKYCAALDAADPWKLKKAMLSLSKYAIWDILEDIDHPALIIGASKDKLHEPENLQKMVARMNHAAYVDLGTNRTTHSKTVVEAIRTYIHRLN